MQYSTPYMRPAGAWSKRTDELVGYVASGCRPSLQIELRNWIDANSRFADFVAANRDKIRKKLRSASTEDGRLDVRAELLVASRVLADRRFEVGFEMYGSRQAAPDLSVTYRSNQRFNLEVTRLRSATEADPRRLASVIAAKARQLPAETPNALAIVASTCSVSEDDLSAAIKLVKQSADAGNDAFGLRDAREFYGHYLRLGAVLFVVDDT